jgi:hypothetical protein
VVISHTTINNDKINLRKSSNKIVPNQTIFETFIKIWYTFLQLNYCLLNTTYKFNSMN